MSRTVSLQDAWLGLPANARGALLITLGTVFFAVNDVFVKTAGLNIHPVQMGFIRYTLGVVFLVPLFVRLGWQGLATKRLGTHLIRAVIAGTGQVLIYYSVIHLMLADATVISFSRPLFMTLLAVVFLGEAVGWRRWTATAIGFVGVLVMVRPGEGPPDIAMLVGLGAALLFSVGLILIRHLAPTEPATRILFYYHVLGALLFAGPAAWMWQPPTPAEWMMLLMIGVLTTAGMVCFVRGFHVGEASILAPMEYTRLIYATILGYFVFAEIPVFWTWIGAVIIIACAVYIARREAFQTAARPRSAA